VGEELKPTQHGVGVFLVFALWLSPVSAAEPTREPILRIEAGMHTAAIRSISVDAANRYLVTGSQDKTVRIWDLATERLLRVLRPPIGAGNEGMIFAAAISPDGATVACGGWTGYEWDSSNSVYLFDRATGHLRRRLPGLGNVVMHLAFSPDGRFLAATLGVNQGLRVYETSSWRHAVDQRYGGSSLGAAWGPNGRLATTSFDGYVRLYQVRATSGGPHLTLLTTRELFSREGPSGIAFNPSGRKLAVAYESSTRISVLSGTDLAPLYEPDTTGTTRSLRSVAWSSQGDILFAGGQHGALDSGIVRRWEGGRYRDLAIRPSDDSIQALVSLRDGGVAFGASDPSWGVLDRAGQLRRLKARPIANFRGSPSHFRVSDGGATVEFGTKQNGQAPARFSLPLRTLISDPEPSPRLAGPQTSGLAIEWASKIPPTLDGNPLKINAGEMSRSVAILDGGERFVLGAEWNLWGFDRKGVQLWPPIPAPGTTWAVNVPANAKVVLAAYADGTIRWHRLSDGKEVLALFPHQDRTRWILWIPSGYYDASAGAEDLLGWHVNNGREAAADFFPASKFRGTFHRPDVVARVLDTLDEPEAIRLANEAAGRREARGLDASRLPPVVTILSPKLNESISGSPLSVRFSVRPPSTAPVTALEARVDGTRVAQEHDLRLTGEVVREMRVPVPPKNSTITIGAGNQNGWGEAQLHVKWAGPVRQGIDIRPTLYVLVIGVSEYEEARLRKDVEFASKDARDFAAAVRRQKGGLYKDVVVQELVTKDKTATREELLKGLVWIEQAPTANDVSMIFMAGHGVRDEKGRYFFLPSKHDPKQLRVTALEGDQIVKTLTDMAGTALVFLDTCYSGDILGPGRGDIDTGLDGFVNELLTARKEGVVFASSAGNQKSRQVAGNGAFTKALVDGLNGRAVLHGTTKITVQSLGVYIGETVKHLTGRAQTPPKPAIIRKDGEVGPDYPLAILVP
jgi:WD40 repeat protein